MGRRCLCGAQGTVIHFEDSTSIVDNTPSMCGRFVFFELKDFIRQLHQYELPFVEEQAIDISANYNIAPDTDIVALLGNQSKYTLTLAHWGVIPHWAKAMPKVRPINARAETLAIKPYFRHMLHRTHCIIPASGFYEWKQTAQSKKQPYYIHRADGKPMAFAGLWDIWKADASAAPVVSCTIITADANSEMKFVHDRMPVILEPEPLCVNIDVASTEETSNGVFKSN